MKPPVLVGIVFLGFGLGVLVGLQINETTASELPPSPPRVSTTPPAARDSTIEPRYRVYLRDGETLELLIDSEETASRIYRWHEKNKAQVRSLNELGVALPQTGLGRR